MLGEDFELFLKGKGLAVVFLIFLILFCLFLCLLELGLNKILLAGYLVDLILDFMDFVR
jgi:hypothetical protein